MGVTLEEGQIDDTRVGGQEPILYNPAYEWPGDGPDGDSDIGSDFQDYSGGGPSSSSSSLKPGLPIFRLVVEQSFVIRTKKPQVAVIDSYHEVQLGRDAQVAGSATPRIRLKEMEVSKLHATIYWDGARKEWNVVDMGSKHGTFLKQAPGQSVDLSVGNHSPEKDTGVRLSKPRAASVPWRLRHADRLTIGNTIFVVHLHNKQRPCQDCTAEGKEELPLFPTTRTSRLDVTGDSTMEPLETKDPKKALSLLKRSLITRHTAGKTLSTSVEYIDRAARRRMMNPGSHSESPGVLLHPDTRNILPPVTPTAKEPVSQPPTALPSTNIGHRLLLQQGWNPGTALGLDFDKDGLIEPLEVKSTYNRAGLGAT